MNGRRHLVTVPLVPLHHGMAKVDIDKVAPINLIELLHVICELFFPVGNFPTSCRE